MCPHACKRALSACVQASALYGAELWWDDRTDRKDSGVKKPYDELQKLENQLGRVITGNFRTTNLGAVIVLAPSRESLLNNGSQRHVLRLLSLPKGDQAKSLPGYDTAMGQRMVHFSGCSGRVEDIFLPGDGPTKPGANISIADAEWAEQEARRADSQPGQVLWTDGSQGDNGVVGYAVVRKKAREEGPHGILPGGIRRRVRRHCARLSGGSGAIQAAQTRQSPHLHRCASRDHADDARRAWPGPNLCPLGEEGDSSPARAGAFCRDLVPLVPRTQRDPWERGRGWMGQVGAG